MALYWPKQKVALVIEDDPRYTLPPESDASWLTVPLTSAQIGDYESYRRTMTRVADLLARRSTPASEDVSTQAAVLSALPKSA